VHAAEKALSTLQTYHAALPASGGDPILFASVLHALEDDLNLPAALGALFTAVHRGPEAGERTAFERAMFALG
jgi:cysteinyl-tRNA synthetase